MHVKDFQGNPLNIGDEVVFISGPNALNKGMVTGERRVSKSLTLVEIVVQIEEGKSHTLTCTPFLCAKLH